MAMQAEMNTIIKEGNKFKKAQIFGYRTNGIPGIELIAPSNRARLIKEKIIFFTRTMRIKVPVKRFVMVLELSNGNQKINQIDESEFAFLLMYWHLCEAIALTQLSRCWTWGRLDPAGIIWQCPLVDFEFSEESTLITMTNTGQRHQINTIDPRDLLSAYSKIQFKDLRPEMETFEVKTSYGSAFG